jgi:hypothetical protein
VLQENGTCLWFRFPPHEGHLVDATLPQAPCCFSPDPPMRVGGWAWRRRGCHCWAGESELPDHDSNAEQGTRSARAPSSSRRRRLAWRSRGPHGSCIDIEERDPIGLLGAGDQSWDLVGKPGQDSGTDLVELLDVTVSEGSQVGAQRRGRPAASRQRRLGDRRGAHAGPGHQHRPGHRSTQPDPGPSDSALCRYRHKADYAEVLVMPMSTPDRWSGR